MQVAFYVNEMFCDPSSGGCVYISIIWFNNVKLGPLFVKNMFNFKQLFNDIENI